LFFFLKRVLQASEHILHLQRQLALHRTKADAETRGAASGSALASIEEKNASLLARLNASMVEHTALSARVADAESRVLKLQELSAASEHARAAQSQQSRGPALVSSS
jgi:hypothetical protein